MSNKKRSHLWCISLFIIVNKTTIIYYSPHSPLRGGRPGSGCRAVIRTRLGNDCQDNKRRSIHPDDAIATT